MDSGNSGSLQSSSGGDEEYDSRAAADSFFMTSHGGGGEGACLSMPPPALFDPFSSYMPNLSIFNNPNSAWPGSVSLRSDPNSGPAVEFNNVNSLLSGSPVFQSPATGGAENGGSAAPAAPNSNQAVPRNPRKRSRASRRAPTTVLTTDTTNFRAMVQEFTGIPAPPFNNSSFPRTRLDLFAARSGAALEPPYLRRPFAQKVQSPPQPPPFPPSSAIISQVPNLFNFPNPLLNSVLQANPKLFYPNNNSQSKPNHHASFGIPPKIDGLDQFAFSSGDHADQTLTGLPSLISSDQKNPDHPNADDRSHYQAPVGPGSGLTTAAPGKTYTPASASNEKGPENIGGREGMMESWICSSE